MTINVAPFSSPQRWARRLVDKHTFLLKRRRRFNQQSAIPWKSLFDVSRTCLNEFDYEWRRVPRLSFKNQSGPSVSDVARRCLRERARGTSLQLRPVGHGNKPVGISSSNSFTNTTDARTSRSIKINKQRNGFLIPWRSPPTDRSHAGS